MKDDPLSIPLTGRAQFGASLFWTWNLIFLAFLLLGFAPNIVPELIRGLRIGAITPVFLIYGLVLTAIPLVTMIIGLTVLRHNPERLFALGYAVEGPLMLLLTLRFFIIRQATPAVTLIMVVAALGMTAFLWDVLDRRIAQRGALASHLRMVGLTLFLITALYAGLWAAFYAAPLLGLFLRWVAETLASLARFWTDFTGLLRDLVQHQLRLIPLFGLGFVLLLFTATLFVLMPIAVPALAVKAWLRAAANLRLRFGALRPVSLASFVLVVTAALAFLSNRQPQTRVFNLLAQPPATPAEAQALLAEESSIRQGLLNAYLGPVRYLSAVG